MLDSGEGCKNSLVGIHGQTEWVLGKSCTIYGPVYELVTCVSSCSEGSSRTFVVSACAFYTTHCWIIEGNGYSMLDSGEGCKNSLVGIHGQTEWVLGKSCTIYGPAYELVTCVSSCSEGSSCALLVRASTFYGTHSRVVGGGCNRINWFWQGEGVLVGCRGRNHLVSSVRHSVDSYAVSCIAACCIGSYVEVARVVPSEVHE